MPFNAHFLVVKTANKNVFQLVDDSSGSDANLTGRVIQVYKTDGTLLGTPINWPIANSTITLDIMDKDYALNISVFWNSSNPDPSPSTYTFDQLQAFVAYGEDFYYGLTQKQTSNPNILKDQEYYYSKMKLRVEMDSALQAITVGEDIYGSQSCIDRYTYLISKQTLFF